MLVPSFSEVGKINQEMVHPYSKSEMMVIK